MADLTDKQQRFVEEYLLDLNATQAAQRAGYSERSARQAGSENLSKPYIQEAVRKRMKERSSRVFIDATFVLERLREIVDRCMTALPVFDRDGEPTGEWQFDSRGALKGLELIGRHVGMFDDRLRVDVNGSLAANLPDAETPEEAREHIAILLGEIRQQPNYWEM